MSACLFFENNPEGGLDLNKAIHAKGAAWPEIIQGMKKAGIPDKEIYIHDNRLCLIRDIPQELNHDLVMAELAK
jgi:L-rhamnose mutarotase